MKFFHLQVSALQRFYVWSPLWQTTELLSNEAVHITSKSTFWKQIFLLQFLRFVVEIRSKLVELEFGISPSSEPTERENHETGRAPDFKTSHNMLILTANDGWLKPLKYLDVWWQQVWWMIFYFQLLMYKSWYSLVQTGFTDTEAWIWKKHIFIRRQCDISQVWIHVPDSSGDIISSISSSGLSHYPSLIMDRLHWDLMGFSSLDGSLLSPIIQSASGFIMKLKT